MSEINPSTDLNPEDEYAGIFNIEAGQLAGEEDDSSAGNDPDFYKVSLKNPNVKDNVYKSRIRFVPNPHDRNLQKVSKWIYLLPDPENQDAKFYVDCPSNLGTKASRFNIISTAFFTLKDHDSKLMRNIGKAHFSRKRQHWSLVQILLDTQEPSYENKVKIFRFGKQIDDMILEQGKADPSVQKDSVPISHPFKGKDFILFLDSKKIEDNREMPSYERSYFDDKITSISLDNNKTRLPETQESMKKIFDYLKAEAPDLSKVCFKAWDDEIEQRVIESVRVTIGDDSVFDKIYAKVYKKKHIVSGKSDNEQRGSGNKNGSNQGASEKKSETSTSASTESMDDLTSKVSGDENQTTTTSSTEQSQSSGEPVVESFNDVDEFDFDDLPTD